MDAALTTVSNVISTCMTTIAGNDLLMALFATALVGAGFGLVSRAKSSVL